MTLQVQTLTLLSLLASGMLLGAVYDSYTVVLREWRFLRFLTPLLDISFWISGLLFVFLLLLRVNQADFRFYIYILLLVGWLVYRVTLRQAVIQSIVGIILAIGWLFRTIYRMIDLFLIQPIKWILRVLYFTLLYLNRLLKGLERVLLWPFESMIRLLIIVATWLTKPIVTPVVRWAQPYLHWIAKKWARYLNRLKELKSILSNWLVRKDDEDDPNDKKRPPS